MVVEVFRIDIIIYFFPVSVTECIQSCSDSLKGVYAHSSAFNRIQCSLKCIHMHSGHIQPCSSVFNAHSKAFTCTQACSSAFTCIQWWSHSLKGIQSGQTAKGPIDTCLNMRSMRKPFIFASNVRWMFFNAPWLDVIRQKTNDVILQYWEGGNLIGNQNNIDRT